MFLRGTSGFSQKPIEVKERLNHGFVSYKHAAFTSDDIN